MRQYDSHLDGDFTFPTAPGRGDGSNAPTSTTPVFRLDCPIAAYRRAFTPFPTSDQRTRIQRTGPDTLLFPSQTTLRIAVVRRAGDTDTRTRLFFNHSLFAGGGASYTSQRGVVLSHRGQISILFFSQLYFGMLPHRQPWACATHRESVRYLADRQRLTPGSHAVCVLRVTNRKLTQPTKDVRASRQTLHAHPDSAGSAWNGGCHGPSISCSAAS
jgi:hypothetical protein